MKKRIVLILILMSACVTGITFLQLYWNYQNYKSTVKTFKHDINEALDKAIEREMDARERKIVARFKGWLADTTFVTITCNNKNRDSNTVFTLADTHPYFKKDRGVSFSINAFTEKLSHITPKAKAVFINHMGDSTLRHDLKNGFVYFYTQRLGDSLVKVVDKSRCNAAALGKFYKDELLLRDIDAPFVINPKKQNNPRPFLTRTLNAGLQRPAQKDMVFAGFESPNLYFLRVMKWLIVTSLLLISITIFCFAYTVKTLLSQQKLAELKNDFVNNMTHELKTPVATINIAAEAIQDFNLSKASADEYLGIIRYQAGNLTNLIDQILKSVISEQDSVSLNLSKVNIDQLINGIVQEYKPQSDKANVIVNYNNEDEVLQAIADKPLLKNAIANLLDNAIKYGGPGSVINIGRHIENGSIIISVTDNGPGIPAQYQDKVFDRFFRVPSGDIHNVKGYGLGLSYAKSIIEKHKGTLSLTSKEGRGTKFMISIPFIYHETSQSSVA
ncbi:sensor histidine kinase [Mucilaginibacter xinganensis]|nr:HAMP domain-containing sensor histidine kinase [Mucilaginibacter xinganensis]